MTKMSKTINEECTALDFFSTGPILPVNIPNPDSEELNSVLEKVYDESWREHWVNSSGKSDPPPDFYSDEYNLMMEMMIVDDHARTDGRGHRINPQKASDDKAYKVLKEALDPELFKQLKGITITAPSDLPSELDHNYLFYVDEFDRVLSKHIEKIELYRANHPGYKLVFFIVDESSLYVEIEAQHHDAYRRKQEVPCSPHCPFIDSKMVQSFERADVDYVIWWMPNRLADVFNIPTPTVVVFKPQELLESNLVRDYDPEMILSSEE